MNMPKLPIRSKFGAVPKVEAWKRIEYLKCRLDAAYFIQTYCSIEDKTRRVWLPFRLWPAQYITLHKIETKEQVVILKARQLGLTWLAIAFSLWMMLFQPGSGVLLFSRRADEAEELLKRMRQMHLHLPPFLQAEVGRDNRNDLEFVKLGSLAQSFATTRHSGRSFTATLAVIDEADFIHLLRPLMNAVKPTIDAGGRLVLLSTVNKADQGSEFKRIWAEAIRGENNFLPIFLPWQARPERTEAWYRKQAADYSQDDLNQEYPSSPEEALAPRISAKRFDPRWLQAARGDAGLLEVISSLPGLRQYHLRQTSSSYLVGADPAEGNPGSDYSAATVFDKRTWEQVAVLHGRWEPYIFASHLVALSGMYNHALVCCERNNHGHAVHVALQSMEFDQIYRNPFDRKHGWLTNQKFKQLAFNNAASAIADGSVILNDEATIQELSSIDGANLQPPTGRHSDLAMAAVIALAALRWDSAGGEASSVVIPPEDPLAGMDAV